MSDSAKAVGTLTPRMERFCQEYLLDLNASAAYRRAYPSCKSARAAAASSAQLMARPAVSARIAELQRTAADKAALTAEWVLKRLMAEIEFKGEGSSHAARVSAIGLAMKHLGLFLEDAPNPARPSVDLSKLTDEQKAGLLLALRAARSAG